MSVTMIIWVENMSVATTDISMDRFFYHSFPRRGRNDAGEVAKGCKILSLMRNGLLLAPESQHPHADGSPPRTQEI
jgi:hypothetical protein